MASEASYVYILSGQKLIETVLPDLSFLIGQKLVENILLQMRYFEWQKFIQNAKHGPFWRFF